MGQQQAFNDQPINDRHERVGVDTIIRMHDVGLLPDLDRALFSLFHQTYLWVSPIVVLQGFPDEDEDRVRQSLVRYDWRAKGAHAQVVNVPNPDKVDLRSKLLNEGIASGRGRYFTILDCDDYLYSSAIQWLVDSLDNGKYVISFGDIVLKYVASIGPVKYTYSRASGVYKGSSLDDLLIENFCPIHSFIIDRSMIDPKDLHFCEEIARLEDYEFLIRICSKYEANFGSRTKAVGVYNWKSDGSNSTVTGSESLEEIQRKNEPWDRARKFVELTREAAIAKINSNSR